jgi:transposase
MQAGDNGFQLTEVSADKAYLSRANLALVDDYGATPFIPFKKSSIAKPMGGNRIWRKMYHYFSLNQDEFLAHYHARSNVETSFMAIKRKFGDTLKAKTLPSQINELLCKVIAYNVVQVIHETHELGRDFSFLAERDGPPKGLIMTME